MCPIRSEKRRKVGIIGSEVKPGPDVGRRELDAAH